ncbi:MAG: GIY-YIG nuclease family protein [Rhodothermales bacterium]|nr:GIY-YIG nuclease family protein [Rhodothermales bacterium]
MKQYYVYIMSSKTRVLYVGVTGDLERRVAEHVAKTGSRFTTRYNVTRLVYTEAFDSAEDAIQREKQLKHWRRSKKVALVTAYNPDWEDLAY